MKRTLKGNVMDTTKKMSSPFFTSPCCFISVDIEATGPTPGHYSMYELGACVVGDSGEFERHIDLLPNGKFHREALRAVGVTIEGLQSRANTVSPQNAMRDFADWAQGIAKGRKLVFVANNAPFDWMFVAWYFEEVGVTNPFGHSALDMKAYFMGKTGFGWSDATLAKMAQYAEIAFNELPHKALLDARIQERILVGLDNPAKETL